MALLLPPMFPHCRGEQPENTIQAAPREAAVAGKTDALASAQATLITTTLYKKIAQIFSFRGSSLKNLI